MGGQSRRWENSFLFLWDFLLWKKGNEGKWVRAGKIYKIFFHSYTEPPTHQHTDSGHFPLSKGGEGKLPFMYAIHFESRNEATRDAQNEATFHVKMCTFKAQCTPEILDLITGGRKIRYFTQCRCCCRSPCQARAFYFHIFCVSHIVRNIFPLHAHT